MEEIYTERFSYATITLFKDYSKLSDKKMSLNYMNVNLDSFDDDEESLDDDPFVDKRRMITSFLDIPKKTGRLVDFPYSIEKRKTKFFYGTNDISERVNINYAVHEFDTTRDSQIKRHYGNPFAEILITTTERSIRKHGDKITIKIYHGSKYRMFNSIYFKKSYHVVSLTINTKNGNFIVLEKSKSGRRTSSKFRTNSFMLLNNVSITNHSFFNVHNKFKKTSRLYREMISAFDNVQFTSKIQEYLFGEKLKSHANYTTNPNNFIIDFIPYFIDKKQIKVPNGNIEYFLSKFYPTEKFLKKNDRKLVASVLDIIGLKSKSTIKMLHKFPDLDLVGLSWLCSILGKNYSKYLGNLNDDVLSRMLKTESPYSYGTIGKEHLINRNQNFVEFVLLDVEKENLIKILSSDDARHVLSESSCRMYDDHFNMIRKIREYVPDTCMRARNMKEFNDEHRELSRVMSGIKKGWVIEYQYDDKTILDLESPIECLYDDKSLHTLYPYILKREEDYMEEGSFMHHCVATYADKDKSMIVSLRDKDGTDRVTVEYDIQKGKPVQKRHFCNQVPPEKFNDGLLLLDDKVRLHARWGTLNWKEKKKVPVKINGIELKIEDRNPRQPEFRLPF